MPETIFTFAPIETVRDDRLDLAELRVLLCLLSFRDDATNFEMPHLQDVALRCGIPSEKVERAVIGLENLGWIEEMSIEVPEVLL